MTPAFTATTAGITVSVQVFYLPDQSKPEQNHYVWAYRINIRNDGDTTVQLLRRTWHITDATGHTQIVHGKGVVGETPLMGPGAGYEYTSGTPLPTSSGFMVGKFHMQYIPSGAEFDVAVPAFSLDSPHQNTRLH
jgi:ApaG protein